MPAAIPLLVHCPLPPYLREQIPADRYEVLYAPDEALGPAIAEHGARIRAVLTIGTIGLAAEHIGALPALELVCALGVGYERIDVAACQARGIVVANGAGTNDTSVADHAFGLLIAAVRGIVALDRGTRAGLYRDQMAFYTPTVSGKRLGIVGMGHIGRQVARRAQGFDMEVAYFSRSARPDLPYERFDSLLALAGWCDFLVVAVPGGSETFHLIDERAMQALGPHGVLVNVARGSVVDTAALGRALRSGTLGAAGIDVYESEPAAPVELLDLDNLVITPHVAGRSPEAMDASMKRFVENADGHFSGRGVVTPV